MVHTDGYSPDGRTIISGDYQGIIRLWDVEKGKCVRTVGDGKFWAERFGFSPNGKLALLGGVKEMQLLDIETGRILKQWTGMDGTVQVAFSPDGKRIVSGDDSGLIHVWDVQKLPRNVAGAKDGKKD
jgi:WD40 repeat protein